MRHIVPVCCALLLTLPVIAQGVKEVPSVKPSGTASSSPVAADKPIMPEVAAVIGAFIEATGGEAAYESLEGLARRYDWSIGSDSGGIDVKSKPGGAFRLDMTMNGSVWHEGQGSNGEQVWLEDAAGECFKASEVVDLQLRMEHDPTAWLHLDRYVRISTVSSKMLILDRPHWRVIMVPYVGRSWYAYFDVETALLSRFEFARPGEAGRLITVERKYADWKSVGPIKLAHKIEEHSIAGIVAISLVDSMVKSYPATTFDMTSCAKAAFARPVADMNPPELAGIPTAGTYHANLIKMIGPTLVDVDGSQISSSILADTPDVLLYFTAKWCGPCRRFTPKLVDFYDKNASSRDFMIVMVSSDRAKDQMAKYLKDYKIAFPAVPFERRDTSGLKKKFGDRGIPNLVWIDRDDDVVESSYNKGTYVGPGKVLAAFSKHMGL
jgi:thiol-disulfide isomerase/thioredoxin